MTRDDFAAIDLLVIGRSGQLAQALAGLAGDRARLAGRPDFDLVADDPAALLRIVRPRAVINASAWTDVNGAESDPDGARALNRDAVARLGAAAREAGARLVHVSTDYVFDGRGGAPYAEDAPVSPVNVYGRSKAEGETALLKACPEARIVRASWVFGREGGSFLNAVLKRAEAGQPLKVVDDQVSAPTFADDLARAVLTLAEAEGPAGVFHYRGGDYASWRDFAAEALKMAGGRFAALPEPEAIPTTAWPQPAERPLDTRLDAGKLAEAYGVGPGDWRAGLKAVLARRYETA